MNIDWDNLESSHVKHKLCKSTQDACQYTCVMGWVRTSQDSTHVKRMFHAASAEKKSIELIILFLLFSGPCKMLLTALGLEDDSTGDNINNTRISRCHDQHFFP